MTAADDGYPDPFDGFTELLATDAPPDCPAQVRFTLTTQRGPTGRALINDVVAAANNLTVVTTPDRATLLTRTVTVEVIGLWVDIRAFATAVDLLTHPE